MVSAKVVLRAQRSFSIVLALALGPGCGASGNGGAGPAGSSGGSGGSGAGGTTASGGTAGMSSAGTTGNSGAGGQGAALTMPIERSGKYVYEFAGVYFEVDPMQGARITALKYENVDLLTGPSVEPNNWGSTFWPSPQSAWNWPPPPEIDNMPYTATLSGTTLTAVGGTNAALGLSVTKTFTPDLAKLGVSVEYKLTNSGTAARSVAPWEITRVFPGGLTFYPTGGAPYAGGGMALPTTTSAGGATWLQYDAASVTGNQKLFADGSGGYLAHAAGSALLIKAFLDTPAALAAPGEGEIEIYLDGQKRYVEVEQQGAYTSLAPGQSLTWTVRWYVRKIPASMTATAGSADLLSLAAQAAAP